MHPKGRRFYEVHFLWQKTVKLLMPFDLCVTIGFQMRAANKLAQIFAHNFAAKIFLFL